MFVQLLVFEGAFHTRPFHFYLTVHSIHMTAMVVAAVSIKPGTAPPPDLGKHLRMTSGSNNRIEMVYVNSQQPTPSKVCPIAILVAYM